MKDWIKKIVLVALITILPLLLLTYIDVKTGQKQDIVMKIGYGLLMFFAPIGFYFVSYRFFKDRVSVARIILTLIITVGLTVVWLFIMLTIVVNFTFAIGGHI